MYVTPHLHLAALDKDGDENWSRDDRVFKGGHFPVLRPVSPKDDPRSCSPRPAVVMADDSVIATLRTSLLIFHQIPKTCREDEDEEEATAGGLGL
jgi:hypothetical protein